MTSRTKIIAEIGNTHEGSPGLARCFIESAANCGVDAVKFQTHIFEAESLPHAPNPPYFSDETRQEYFDLPDKATAGQPTSFYYDPGRDQGRLYLWPVLGSVTTETLQITYQRTVEDMDVNADDPDYPQEWYEAIVLGLAASLHASQFPQDVAGRAEITARANAAYQSVYFFDRETASVTFVPCGWNG